VRAQVTATACTLPRQTGVPLARWSRAEVARTVAAELAGHAPSASTIGRWLKAERLRPWRYHRWQHIHDPKRFLERARPALQLYARVLSLVREGTWLVCLDEKTSIQAREREQPPRPAHSGQPPRQEARYQRRGARHLFAGLSVADGQVSGTCRERKTFADFQAFVQRGIYRHGYGLVWNAKRLPISRPLCNRSSSRKRFSAECGRCISFSTTVPHTLPSNWSAGCKNSQRWCKVSSRFTSVGYLPTLPGSIS